MGNRHGPALRGTTRRRVKILNLLSEITSREVRVPENRRQYFRLEYPPKSGPKLVSAGVVLEVLDISEQGMMIHVKQNSSNYSAGTPFTGSLTFDGGESLLVFGKITRVNQDKISIELRRPIPLRIIMAEQRRIIQNFKQRA